MPQEQKNTTLREKYNLTRNAKYAAMHMPQEQKNTRNKKRKLAARAGRKR
jgi:hypothetical protein